MANIITIDFTKGLNTSTTYVELEEGQCPIFQNVRLRPNKVIPRFGMTGIGAALPDQWQMLHWCKIVDTEYLLVVANGSVYDAYTGALVPGGLNRFPGGSDCNATWINFWVVMGDGVNPNCLFDGNQITQLTVDPGDAGKLTLTGEGPADNNGTYSYAIKNLNAQGIESDVLTYSSAITVANQGVFLTNIPVLPATENCSGRNLYRTKDGGSAYFLVTTLDNGTTVYSDSTGDANLGPQMKFQDFPNSPLPPCRYWVSHQNRVYAAGCFVATATGSVNTLYVTDTLDPTTARLSSDPTTTYQGGRFPLEGEAGGTIMGLGSYGSMVCVFTGGGMFLFTGNQPGNFQLSNFSTHGCTAHRTILSAQEELVWLAPDGLYLWKAGAYADPNLSAVYAQRSYVRVSDRVRDRIDAMTATDMAQASAVFSDNRYYLCWPGGTLIYDFLFDAWYEDTVRYWRDTTASIFTASSRQRLYGVSIGQPQVWQFDVYGMTTDAGNPIPLHLQTKDHNLGVPDTNKRGFWFGGLFRATNEAMSGSLIRNSGESIVTSVVNLTSGSPWMVVPANANAVRVRQRVPDNALSEWFRLDFQCHSTLGQFEVLEAQIEVEGAGGPNGA